MCEDSRSFMKKIGRDAMNKRPESLTFHEYLNLKLYMYDKGKALENERYHFNYYEEVGKALEKWHKNEETLQLTEQILVEMSLDVEVEEIEKRYPGFKGNVYYETFYNYIDEWLKYQESQ
jgi:hypothetical protein